MIEKTINAGVEVDTVIGDGAYSENGNIEYAKERYKIEAKNAELKNTLGYDVANASGLLGMELQGALSLFTVNLKRIIKLRGNNIKIMICFMIIPLFCHLNRQKKENTFSVVSD